MLSRRGVLVCPVLAASALRGESAPSSFRIEVLKAERQLALFTNGKLSHTFRIGLGFAPVGHKQRQGDGRTPEGTFRMVLRNKQSRYYRSVMLNYPLPADARSASVGGLIDGPTRDAILRSHRRGAVPPQHTPLGGEIFIHGGGSHNDWTFGCIALANPDMDVIFALPLGVRVDVFP